MMPVREAPVAPRGWSAPAREPGGARVLVVTRSSDRAAVWSVLLRRRHFAVTVATSEERAHRLVTEGAVDLAVLDLRDAAVDGLDLCRRLRAEGYTVPVLMLHPQGTLEDLLVGFEVGADCYLRGRIDPAELLCHVGALRRRPLHGEC